MYELVVVWGNNDKDVYVYETYEAAKQAGEGMETALGGQVAWWGVRRQYGTAKKLKENEAEKSKCKQYKAFDFKSGHTYLIGEFNSKADAMAYCKVAGYQVIPQTVVRLTADEYKAAMEHQVQEVTT